MARRVSGFTSARHDVRFWPVQAIEHLTRLLREPEGEHRAAVAIPRAHERFVETLAIAFGRDHRVGAPRAIDFETLQRQADGQRLIVPDDGRTFARDPDARLTGGVVGIAPMLPVPAEARGFGGVGAVRAAVQRVHAATVLGAESIDVRHEDANPGARSAPEDTPRLIVRLLFGRFGTGEITPEYSAPVSPA